MKRNMEEMVEECVKRMEFLHISKNVIKEFRNGKLNESENGGCLYWLNEKEREYVEEFEKTEPGMYKVFHVIHSITNFGEMWAMLYVYGDDEDWEMDWEGLKDKTPYHIAHVFNKNLGYGESGSVGIVPRIGGLVRTF